MKKRISRPMPVLLFTLAALTGCYNNNEEVLYGNQADECSTVQAKFSTDILPIVNTKCAIAGCHNANAASNSSGFTLQTYSQLKDKVDRIHIRVVTQKTMPPSTPLIPAEINKFKCWIANGALNN